MNQRTASVILLASLLAAAPAPAQEPGPHQQIRSLLRAINDALEARDATALSRLFAPNGELRIGPEVLATTVAAIEDLFSRRSAWSETTPPRISRETIRMVSPDIALVEAVRTQFGSLILMQTSPVLMLLRHNGAGWRIVSLRMLQPAGIALPTQP